RYEQAITIFRDIKNRLGEANTLQSLGDVHRALSENEKARRRYEQAITIFRDIKDRLGEANTLLRLGHMRKALSENEKARLRYEQAITIFRDIKDRLGEANTLQSLGEVHRMLDEYEKARQRYEQAITIYRDIKDRLGQANTLRSLGDVHWMLDENEKARRRYEQAITIFRDIKARLGEANTLQSLGDVHLALSEYEKARLRYEQAITIFRDIKARLGEANTLKSLGLVYQFQNDYKNAQTCCNEALQIQNKIGNRQGMLQSHYLLGMTHEALKNYKEAENSYKISIQLIENVRGDMKVEESKTQYFSSKVVAYESLIDLLFKQKKGADAFPYAERCKARSFLDLLGNKKIDPRNDAPFDLVEKERKLKQAIIAKDRETRNNESKPAQRRRPSQKLVAELLALKQQHNDVLQQIKLHSGEYASMLAVAPLKLEDIQTLIRESGNTVLIEYFTTRKALYLWLLDGKNIYSHKIETGRAELAKKIGEFHTLLSNTAFSVDSLSSRAEELYDLLLKPVENHFKTNSKPYIAIVPHGSLHYLPFEALRSGGKFLSQQDIKIFYLPSASVYKYCREKNRLQKKRLIAFGNPDRTLPFSEAEVNELKRLYPKDSLVFKKGEAKESTAKYYAPFTDILHFSCHGSFFDALPHLSALHLRADNRDDGRLEVHEIFQMKLKPAYLVTLSACQTSLGGIRPGDEIVGLTRAFIYAATSGILASLWSVDDYYTGKFMAAFYRALTTENKIEALHHARLEMMRKYKRIHPFYWSAFVLIGDPR
ncbi:MAG: CHAT domain-containing protein, partial [Candidatus Aminicenantes bacterium]|nr:CHAT domain-containing protein [Candidatus Aminicenantes bacterium]